MRRLDSKKEMKLVRMPRREYLRHSARDGKGRYKETEPERSWSEEALDAAFGRYADAPAMRWVVRRWEEGFNGAGETCSIRGG
jgi:hypothetical protein